MQEENTEKLVQLLQSLVQYKIDSIFIIAQGISCLSDKTLRDKLSEMREECEQHIKVISDLILEHGGKVPEHSRDFKGFFMQGYVGMRGLINDKNAMKALATNTRLLVDAFDHALKENIPDKIKSQLQEIFENAKQDLQYFISKS